MRRVFFKPALAASLVFLGGHAAAQMLAEHPTTLPPKPEKQAPLVEKRLQTLDTLDFEILSQQKWDRLKESHSHDVVVTWPDGHETRGLDHHINDLKAMFVFAPDTAIKEHPIRFGSGAWTSVTGVLSGTFTQAMPVGEGKTIAPTGKRFAIGFANVAHWTGNTMDHEWLYWDNQEFMKQLGLAN